MCRPQLRCSEGTHALALSLPADIKAETAWVLRDGERIYKPALQGVFFDSSRQQRSSLYSTCRALSASSDLPAWSPSQRLFLHLKSLTTKACNACRSRMRTNPRTTLRPRPGAKCPSHRSSLQAHTGQTLTYRGPRCVTVALELWKLAIPLNTRRMIRL